MKRPVQVIGLIFVSGNNLAPQIAALLLLHPRDFGVFSLGYLTYGLAASVALSTISEAHARAEGAGTVPSEPQNYAAASTWLSISFGLISAVIFSILTGSFLTMLVSFVAVGCASRRTTIRFDELRRGDWGKIVTVESISFSVFIAVLITIFSHVRHIDLILMAWSASGILMWVLGSLRKLGSPRGAWIWMSQHKSEIKPLLRDSLILDVSSIGTPYLLAPILGPGPLGIYRAVSNFNAPARLVLGFIRPFVARMPLNKVLSAPVLIVVVGLSLVWGVAFSSLLIYLYEAPSGIAMLDALAPYWLPTGLYMVFIVGAQYFYIIARTKVQAKRLWNGRVVQSSFALFLPIGGALFGSLDGAIWANTVAAFIGNVTWYSIVSMENRRGTRD